MCMNPAEAKKLHRTDDDKMYICSREIVSKVGCCFAKKLKRL